MTRKCNNHLSKTNVWHNEEETFKHSQIKTYMKLINNKVKRQTQSKNKTLLLNESKNKQ